MLKINGKSPIYENRKDLIEENAQDRRSDLIINLENRIEGIGKETIFHIDGNEYPCNKIFAIEEEYQNYQEPDDNFKKEKKIIEEELGIKFKETKYISGHDIVKSLSDREKNDLYFIDSINSNLGIFKKIIELPEFKGDLKKLMNHLGGLDFDSSFNISKSNMSSFCDANGKRRTDILGEAGFYWIKAMQNLDEVAFIGYVDDSVTWGYYSPNCALPVLSLK